MMHFEIFLPWIQDWMSTRNRNHQLSDTVKNSRSQERTFRLKVHFIFTESMIRTVVAKYLGLTSYSRLVGRPTKFSLVRKLLMFLLPNPSTQLSLRSDSLSPCLSITVAFCVDRLLVYSWHLTNQIVLGTGHWVILQRNDRSFSHELWRTLENQVRTLSRALSHVTQGWRLFRMCLLHAVSQCMCDGKREADASEPK